MRLISSGCAVALLALTGADVPAESLQAEASLTGIWASETTFGPALRGELTIAHDGADWRATLAGAESRFRVPGREVRFEFPEHRGEFRGVLSGDGRRIDGFWIQPFGTTEERRDPVGARQSFATRLELQAFRTRCVARHGATAR